MRDAVIVEAVRTPIGKGKPNGALAHVHPVELLAHTLRTLVERSGVDPALIDDVIGGTVDQVGEQAMNVTRSRLGLYSPISAVAFGMMQPRPIPAMKRTMVNSSTDVTRAVSSVSSEKKTVAPNSTGRLPTLSATMVKIREPRRTPKLPAARTFPSTDRGTPHS